MGGSEARMSVSIQVTQSGKSARRPIRLARNEEVTTPTDLNALLEEMNLAKMMGSPNNIGALLSSGPTNQILSNEDDQSEATVI